MPALAFLFSPAGRWLTGLAAVALLVVGAYAGGHHRGAAEKDAQWRATVAAEKRRQTEATARAVDGATKREIVRANANAALEEQINAYVADLAKRPTKPNGGISPSDAAWLQHLQRSSPAR